MKSYLSYLNVMFNKYKKLFLILQEMTETALSRAKILMMQLILC